MNNFEDFQFTFGKVKGEDIRTSNEVWHLTKTRENGGIRAEYAEKATTGCLQKLTGEVFGWDEYRNAFCCIEQANLYVHAPELLQAVEKLLEFAPLVTANKYKLLLEKATNIDEPVKRILGNDSIHVLRKLENEI